jgi:HPr kinase/phosphorylase
MSMRKSVRMSKADYRPYSQESVLLVKRLYEALRATCGLTLCSQPLLDALITSPVFHRPGLALAGWTKHFPRECIQVMGQAEWSYVKSLPASRRKGALDNVFVRGVPAVVFTDGILPDAGVVAHARKRQVNLFSAKCDAAAFVEAAREYVGDVFAPRTSVHGTLVDVCGVGILYVGKSGIGKSECALDLLCKGHALISDDVVHIRRRGDGLVGESNEILGHHMEIRGIGIVNIKDLCGVRSVRSHKRIDVQVELVEWNRDEYFERTGLTERFVTILGVKLPLLRIPVSPGKNISAISELIALHMLARHQGKSTIKELDKKLISTLRTDTTGRKGPPAG